MLVLSRKKGERILIGDNIIIDIVEIRGDKVRLGFTAPTNIRIARKEILSPSTVWRAEEAAKQ
jgi:carbon storage regulator